MMALLLESHWSATPISIYHCLNLVAVIGGYTITEAMHQEKNEWYNCSPRSPEESRTIKIGLGGHGWVQMMLRDENDPRRCSFTASQHLLVDKAIIAGDARRIKALEASHTVLCYWVYAIEIKKKNISEIVIWAFAIEIKILICCICQI